MRSWILALLMALLPALLATGCGSGGSSAPTGETLTGAAPQVAGVVLDVDGETALVGGVPLELTQTGELAVSDETGAFAFTNVPEGDVTLALPGTSGSRKSGDDDDERDDDDDGDDGDDGDDDDEADDDDSDRRDGDVVIRRLRRGDRVFIQIRIDDGRIIEIRITRGDGDDDCDGKRELEIEMRRTDANTDPDMEGEVELEADCDGCQEFEVEVEDATPETVLETVVIDPDDNEESLGTRRVEPDGDAEWKLDTCDGDRLPFGVDGLSALEGHRVEVRDENGVALLRARLPDLPPRDGDVDTCFRVRGRARLVSLVDPVTGYVEIRARGCLDSDRLRQRFKIEAEGLTAGQEVEFFLEDPDNEGQLVSLGTVIANAAGEAQIEFDTGDGDELPFGVETIRELVGLDVQVRDDVSGQVLLEGRVPGVLED